MSEQNNTIYYLQHKDILNKEILINEIYNNLNTNYYFTDSFEEDFYIDLCYLGFISTSLQDNENLYLLPEIQFEYAVLYFKNLHISKKVKKLINKDNYNFKINSNIDELFNALDSYHNPNWLCGEYKELIKKLSKNDKKNFKVNTFLVQDKCTKENIAGEIGYTIGDTYTSLTGFSSSKKEYRNYGKLQLVLTAKYLEEHQYKLWNLGHPYMDYKFELGAIKYTRKEFLEKWFSSI